MSKTSSSDLFNLIRSLSKTEKRYLKLNAFKNNGKKGNKFEFLFNAIERQKEYDEDALPVKAMGITYLPMMKKRLFEMILKSMETYHIENSLETKLRSTINKIEFLFHKGLAGPCAGLIRRAKKVAKDNELWEQLIEILDLESLVLAAYNIPVNAGKLRMKCQEESANTILLLKNRVDYLRLSIAMTEFTRERQAIRSKNEIKFVNSVMADPLLKSEKMALSLKAKSTYYYVLSKEAFLKARYREADNYALHNIQVSTPKKDPSLTSILTYFNSVAGYLNYCLTLRYYKDAEQAVLKLKAIPFQYNIKGSDFLQSSIYTMSTGNLFVIYLDCGEFQKAEALINEVEKNRPVIEKNISTSNKIVLSFYFFYTHFGLGKYKTALTFLNNTLTSIAKTGLREDYYSLCKILILVVHHELGHYDLLAYLTKSAFRKLKKINELHSLEFVMLGFFNNRLPEVNTVKGRIELFSELKKELTELRGPVEKQLLQSFDLISWVDSKIENRPFADLVREKAKDYN